MPNPNTEFHVPEEPVDPVPLVPEAIPPIYERQHSLGLHRPSVILVGAGGVGCWTALALVLGGVDNLTIFDGDQVSLNNLNRLPLPEAMVGELKSVALARWLETLRPHAHIQARGMFDPEIHRTEADWVVCCTDSLKSRQVCYRYTTEYGAKYLELGADGERWTLSPTPPEFSTELEDAPGYSSVPIHVGPCMMAGAAAAYYVLHDCKPIISHSVDWKKGPIILAMPNLGALKFESINEVMNLTETEFYHCPEWGCGIEIERNLILLIKHKREHFPNWSLVEAKAHVENELAQLDAIQPEPEDDIVREASEVSMTRAYGRTVEGAYEEMGVDIEAHPENPEIEAYIEQEVPDGQEEQG